MKHLLSQQERNTMREAGKMLAQVLSRLEESFHVGQTPMDLERLAEEEMKTLGVKPAFKGYHGFPAILCVSVNDEAVHGIPNERPFQHGDLVKIDCGLIHNGLYMDSALALIAGEKEHPELVDPAVKAFRDTTTDCLWKALAQVKAGATIGDLGHAIEEHAIAHGYSIIRDLTGHGIGRKLHQEPFVYNYGEPGQGPKLEVGMALAIEPILSMGRGNIETLDDEWTIVTKDASLACQQEHTVLITEKGCEVLTLRAGERNRLIDFN